MAGPLHLNVRRGAAAFVALGLVAGAFIVGSAPSAWAQNPLTITKSASPSIVAPGERLTYTLVVTNTGGAKLTEVVLTDTVNGLAGEDGTNPTSGTNPLELTSAGSSSTSGSCGQSGNTVTCNKGILEGFESWTVTISGNVIAADGTTLNNTATVSGTKSATTHTASDTIQTRVDSRAGGDAPDLTVSVKGPNTVPPSNDIVYTVTVGNLGDVKASDVALTVTMPNEVTFLVAEATNLFNCSLEPPQAETTTLSCTGGAVNAGENATVQVGVQAPDPFDAPITVTAAVDPFDAIFETNEENNFAQATTTDGSTPPPDDLVLEKTDAPDPLAPSEQLTYTLTLENTSAHRADYVEVVDGTQGLEAASVTATATMTNAPKNAPPMECSVAAPTVTCTTTRFQPGAIATIVIGGTVIAKPGSTILNTATVNGNIKNTGITHTASTITTVKPSIDLTVTQHRTLPEPPTPVRAADRFDYAVTVGNSGLYDANDVVVRQPLPAGTDTTTPKDDVFFDGFVASHPGTTCAVDADNVVTCTIPTVQGAASSGQTQGTTETITLQLIAPHAIGPITSTVTVDPTNIIPENFEDNNTATTTTDVLTGIDLTVSKEANHDPIARNGTLRYTVTVPNLGTQDAEGIVVRDVLPEGAVFRSATDTAPFHNFTCRQDGINAVVCEGGRINGTYSGSLTVPVDAAVIEIDAFAPDEPGVYHNEVRVDPLNAIPEKDETNNLFLLNTTVENTHTGDGMYKELFIDMLEEVSPDLPPYATNGLLDYDLVVANAGQSAVGAPDNLVVRITLPEGSRFRAAYDQAGAVDGAFTCTYPGSGLVVECFGGTVESASTRAIRIETFAPSTQGEALIQAMVDPDNEVHEADETNNTADERTVIEAGEPPDVQGTYIDLKVADITDSHDPVGTNSTLDYAVTIANLGVADAFDVAFVATLPEGSTFRSADDADPADPAAAFNCTHAGGVVTCTGGRVDGGAARTVNIRIFAPGEPSTSDPATQAHLVVQVDPDKAIPEGHEGNNSAEEFTKVEIDGPGGYIDLLIEKTSAIDAGSESTDGGVIPGGGLTYQLEVSNDGTDDAFNVAVRDVLPPGMTFVSATPLDNASNFVCQESGGVIDCTGGYIRGADSGGGQRLIEIKAKAPQAHELQITNQAFVDPEDQIPEQSEINNTAQAQNIVRSNVDLHPEMDAGTAGTATEGTWTFRAKNLNVGTARNVLVVANFSAGTIHLNTAAPGWSCEVFENPVNQVRCVGDLEGNDTASFEVQYFKTADETINSYVIVDPDDTIVESDETNNRADATG